MAVYVNNLFKSKDLLVSWTSRNIRARYQQSLLGWFWAIIQPAATVLIFTLVFTKFVPINTGNTPYAIFSYVATVPWVLLSSSLADMSNALVFNMNLVTKIYFPREALPIAAMLARVLDFIVASVLLVFLMVYYRIPLYPAGLPFIPLIILIQLMLIMGLGLILSALNVFYRDIQPLLTLGLQLWFYASPIIYPVSLVPERFRIIYYINPMAGILQGYRDVLLDSSQPGVYLLIAGVTSLAFLLFGYWLFKRVEYLFADIL